MNATVKSLLMSSFIVLFGFLSVSCEKESPDNDQSASGIPFFKSGNTWTYKMTIDGKNAPSDITYKLQSIDEDGYCTILFTTSSTSHTEYVWYANHDFFADESGSEPEYWFPLLFKNGNAVGKKWTAPVEDDDLGKITREILSISETITIPSGTFSNCVKVKETFANDAKIINYYFLSEQNGILKKETTGWADVDEQPRIYFPIIIELKNKNF